MRSGSFSEVVARICLDGMMGSGLGAFSQQKGSKDPESSSALVVLVAGLYVMDTLKWEKELIGNSS